MLWGRVRPSSVWVPVSRLLLRRLSSSAFACCFWYRSDDHKSVVCFRSHLHATALITKASRRPCCLAPRAPAVVLSGLAALGLGIGSNPDQLAKLISYTTEFEPVNSVHLPCHLFFYNDYLWCSGQRPAIFWLDSRVVVDVGYSQLLFLFFFFFFDTLYFFGYVCIQQLC